MARVDDLLKQMRAQGASDLHLASGSAPYMRIDGDPKVYLMSRFIGAEWMAALEGVKAR